MKVGQEIENAIWLTGEETEAQKAQYEIDVRNAIGELCSEYGLRHGPVSMEVLKPGDERVPEVPNHISGFDVKLWVFRAEVIGKKSDLLPNSFLGDLEKKDLELLRQRTRMACHTKTGEVLSDAQCDEVIEEIGPEAAMDAVRRSVDGGLLH